MTTLSGLDGDIADVLIVGAGFGGLGTAIRLKQAGVDRVRILERGQRIGGTWRDNVYAGAACDVPSALYSFSFAPNPDWTRTYSGSAEILAYIDAVAAEHDLVRHVVFGQNVTGLRFDQAAGLWTATTAEGVRHRGRTVVMAAGPLSNASLPKLQGIETYEGRTIHSARWDPAYDFTGKKVAVIGTGASGVQIVPELVKTARNVEVFQRTAGWVLPRPDFETPAWMKGLHRQVPLSQAAFRAAIYAIHEAGALGIVWNTPMTAALEHVAKAHLRRQVRDRWLRRQLTPDFRIGCKRVLMTSDYYPALQRSNCKLVTWPIVTLSPRGIRTADGIEHEVDAIVFATGFDVAKTGTPFPIHGKGGRSLDEEWRSGARAHKSVSVAGYPNLFFTFGPNSGPGHNSALVYMEAQMGYIVEAVHHLLRADLRSLEVRADVQDRFNVMIQRRLADTNWASGCKSWYLTEDGTNATMFPGFATQFVRQMRTFDPAEYASTPRVSGAHPPADGPSAASARSTREAREASC